MRSSLRLKLAFRRVRDELLDQPKSGRALVANLFELDLVEVEYKSWIDELTRRVIDDLYVPGPIETCPAPKGGGLVRPGVRLGLADRVVYTAAVGGCVRPIHAATKWSQRTIDFAPRLNTKALSGQHWMLSPFIGWNEWRQSSLRKLARASTRVVLTADIAGYFDNISLPRLRSDLGRIGCPDDAVAMITKCLNHWALTEHRGIPQGVLASDLLAKLYLESFDRALKSEGYTHLRYSDDIRVFCRSQREAQRALLLITELLRSRGLTLQSAKTRIRPADDLTSEFEGAVPAIKSLNRAYIDETFAAGIMASDPSLPVSVIDDLANAEPHVMDSEVIHRAFRQFVLQEPNPNRTMFHYVLRRLGGRGDNLAVAYCSRLLLERPEETGEVLRYFEQLSAPAEVEVHLAAALASRDLDMYDYQRYLILYWLWRNSSTIRARTVQIVRKLAFGKETSDYVRVVARAVIGRFGNHSDLEHLVSLFASSSDPLERAQLLCCLSRLERGRRNAMIGRVKKEGPWVRRAVTLVRSGKVEEVPS